MTGDSIASDRAVHPPKLALPDSKTDFRATLRPRNFAGFASDQESFRGKGLGVLDRWYTARPRTRQSDSPSRTHDGESSLRLEWSGIGNSTHRKRRPRSLTLYPPNQTNTNRRGSFHSRGAIRKASQMRFEKLAMATAKSLPRSSSS
jgi:hypothetical protein